MQRGFLQLASGEILANKEGNPELMMVFLSVEALNEKGPHNAVRAVWPPRSALDQLQSLDFPDDKQVAEYGNQTVNAEEVERGFE